MTVGGDGLKSGATFAWYVDGDLVEGAVSSSFELNSMVAPVSGTYSVTVRTQNSLGDDVSVTATVNVTVQ